MTLDFLETKVFLNVAKFPVIGEVSVSWHHEDVVIVGEESGMDIPEEGDDKI